MNKVAAAGHAVSVMLQGDDENGSRPPTDTHEYNRGEQIALVDCVDDVWDKQRSRCQCKEDAPLPALRRRQSFAARNFGPSGFLPFCSPAHASPLRFHS